MNATMTKAAADTVDLIAKGTIQPGERVEAMVWDMYAGYVHVRSAMGMRALVPCESVRMDS